MKNSPTLSSSNPGGPPDYLPLRRIFRVFRLFVSTRPTLYFCYARLGNLKFQLNSTTEVLVDSYPRSANSFFEAAFTRAHCGRVEVAHHSHAAAQVLAGVRRGLPAIVLLRDPQEAIASFFEMHGGGLPIWLCTQEYIEFYSKLIPVLDKLIVVDTASIEQRFYDLMLLLKEQHGLSVEPYVIDNNVRQELFSDVDLTGKARNGSTTERYSDALSTEAKERRRAALSEIRNELQAPSNADRFDKAKAIYDMFQEHLFNFSPSDKD